MIVFFASKVHLSLTQLLLRAKNSGVNNAIISNTCKTSSPTHPPTSRMRPKKKLRRKQNTVCVLSSATPVAARSGCTTTHEWSVTCAPKPCPPKTCRIRCASGTCRCSKGGYLAPAKQCPSPAGHTPRTQPKPSNTNTTCRRRAGGRVALWQRPASAHTPLWPHPSRTSKHSLLFQSPEISVQPRPSTMQTRTEPITVPLPCPFLRPAPAHARRGRGPTGAHTYRARIGTSR